MIESLNKNNTVSAAYEQIKIELNWKVAWVKVSDSLKLCLRPEAEWMITFRNP